MATRLPSFPPSLRFGSLAIYPEKPRITPLQKNAAAFIVSGVKRDAVTARPPHKSYIQIAIEQLVALMPGSVLEGFFDPAAVLVPLPGSAQQRANSVSATRSICRALYDADLGARVVPCLNRHKAVQKSAFAAPGQRPEAIDHFNSITVDLPVTESELTTVLLVDDVLTRGATSIGAATAIRARFPNAQIKLFALARTDPMGERFYDPCVGTIFCQPNGWVRRQNGVVEDGPASGRLF